MDFDRQPRRDLAGIVAAHAVGHEKEAKPGVAQERVFVGFSNASRVGDAMTHQHR